MRAPVLAAAASFVLGSTLAPAPARAVDPNSMSVSLRALMTSQTLYDGRRGNEPGAGVDLLFHLRAFTLGANVDASSDAGEVDLYGGALLGGEVPIFDFLRLGILGEVGAHHLEDPGTVVTLAGASRHLDGATLPYGGGRVTLDLLVGGSVALDLGIEGIARFDLGRTDTVLRFTPGSVTTYRFGGRMLGAGAHLGIRF